MPGTEIYQPYIDSLNRQHLSSGEIHIDLTIETINKELQSNHLGVISTDHINHWLKTIKSLHPLVIIIKNYLTKTTLNITYEGNLKLYFRWSQYLFYDLHACRFYEGKSSWGRSESCTCVGKVFEILCLWVWLENHWNWSPQSEKYFLRQAQTHLSQIWYILRWAQNSYSWKS